MGRKRKPAKDLTADEAMKKVFPVKVVKEIKKVAHEKDDNGKAANKRRKKK